MSSHGHQLRRSSSALGLDSITPNSAHVGGHSSTAPAPAFWRSKRTLPPPFRTIVSWTRVALHWCRRHARPGASAPPRQLHQRRVQCCAAPLGLPVSSAKQVLDESFYHKIESQAAHGFDDGVPWSVSQMHAQEYDIYFRFICPSGWNKTTDGFGAPLLVLHGGPGVPHDYLLPLHALATDSRRRPRPVLFFDQVGCGLSSKPDLVAYPYSIRQSIREVELAMRVLEDKTGMRARDIHIYGQSWGGILAFEYILLGSPVRSLTISNSPADVHLVEAEADRIIASIDPEKMPMAFLERHQCRDQGNVYLRSAMDKSGQGWRGSGVLGDWRADSVAPGHEHLQHLSTLILGGSEDFVTMPCLEGWMKVLPSVQLEILDEATHMPWLEEGHTHEAYMQTLSTFLCKHDG